MYTELAEVESSRLKHTSHMKPGEITLTRSSNSLVPRPHFPSAESALENNHGERGVVELLGFGCSVVP